MTDPQSHEVTEVTNKPSEEKPGNTGHGKTVALTLGSGGARGYAHIGAIEVLEERGYKIIALSGSGCPDRRYVCCRQDAGLQGLRQASASSMS